VENLVRTEIKDIFLRVFSRETEGQEPPEITDDLVLLETGLDSLGFAILVVELEEEMGFDPFTLSDEAYYPQTFGEFVAFYEANKP
jgi:acyl carrier protein